MVNLPITVIILHSNLMVQLSLTRNCREFRKLDKSLSFTLTCCQVSNMSPSIQCAQILTKSKMKKLKLNPRFVIVPGLTILRV
jgi:hypothetical protein